MPAKITIGAEIQQTVVLEREGKPLVCRIPGEGKGCSIGWLRVPLWDEVFPQLESAFPESEFRTDVLKKLQCFTDFADNLSEWFGSEKTQTGAFT